MIQDVEILNFKCFKSLYIPELSRVNIVGGKNNVGKTALLEALFIFHDRLKPDMFLKTFGWRGIWAVPLDPASLWAPFFRDLKLGEPFEIKLRIDGRAASARYEFNPEYSPDVGPRRTETIEDGSSDFVRTSEKPVFSHSLDISYSDPGGGESRQHLYVAEGKLNRDWQEEPSLLHQTAILPARKREDPQSEANRLSRLIEERKEGLVEEFLSLMAPIDDLQISYTGGAPTIICNIGLPRLVPLGYVGDGMSRLLSIVLAMADTQGGVLLIDEAENGVHYSVQEAFWRAIGKAAREFSCQVIAATHSYEFLRAAHSGLQELFEPEFRYVRLERKGSETVAKTFTHEMLGAALEASMEVR